MVRIARSNAAVTVSMETRVGKQTDTAREAVVLVLQTTNVTQVKRFFSHISMQACVYISEITERNCCNIDPKFLIIKYAHFLENTYVCKTYSSIIIIETKQFRKLCCL
jgi:hypothetical protein